MAVNQVPSDDGDDREQQDAEPQKAKCSRTPISWLHYLCFIDQFLVFLPFNCPFLFVCIQCVF